MYIEKHFLYYIMKKITIKPFLNTHLEPVGSESTEKGIIPIYSLYYKVTYNRKSTQLKSYYSLGFSSLNEDEAKKVIAFESRILENIISYEIELSPNEEYQVSGLKKKYSVYVLSIHNILDIYLRDKLRMITYKSKEHWHLAINFQTPSIYMSALVLHDMCQKLFTNFDALLNQPFKDQLESFKLYHQLFFLKQLKYDFATVIDWKNGTHKKELETRLKKILKNNSEEIAIVLNHIDEMVMDKWEKSSKEY